MKISLSYNKDFLAGLLLLFFGGMGMFMALDYPFGSSLRMGPGYFPRVLAAILMTFGLFVLVRGLMTPERVKGVWGWKALAWIVASLVAFGFVMDKFGMIPALAVMFVLASAAGHEFKWKEVIILTILMSIFAILVFVKGLGLPYPLIEGWY
jgi:hypothetical protein